jgi:hypothetical protein
LQLRLLGLADYGAVGRRGGAVGCFSKAWARPKLAVLLTPLTYSVTPLSAAKGPSAPAPVVGWRPTPPLMTTGQYQRATPSPPTPPPLSLMYCCTAYWYCTGTPYCTASRPTAFVPLAITSQIFERRSWVNLCTRPRNAADWQYVFVLAMPNVKDLHCRLSVISDLRSPCPKERRSAACGCTTCQWR